MRKKSLNYRAKKLRMKFNKKDNKNMKVLAILFLFNNVVTFYWNKFSKFFGKLVLIILTICVYYYLTIVLTGAVSSYFYRQQPLLLTQNFIH